MTVVQGRPRMAMMIGSAVRRLTECDEIADRQPGFDGQSAWQPTVRLNSRHARVRHVDAA